MQKPSGPNFLAVLWYIVGLKFRPNIHFEHLLEFFLDARLPFLFFGVNGVVPSIPKVDWDLKKLIDGGKNTMGDKIATLELQFGGQMH